MSLAAKLFRSFFGREPKNGDVVRVGQRESDAIRVGKVLSIVYVPDGSRTASEHAFRKHYTMYVSDDGRHVFWTGSGDRFTGRGFED